MTRGSSVGKGFGPDGKEGKRGKDSYWRVKR